MIRIALHVLARPLLQEQQEAGGWPADGAFELLSSTERFDHVEVGKDALQNGLAACTFH